MAHPVVVVVDVQERLFNAVDAERRDDMVTNVTILANAARRLGVPVLVTEQYPKGLGRTLPEVRSLLGEAPPFEKTAFTATETVVFQRLGSADSDAFRELSKLLR
jgi:nicotinamidase-related amidase